jgi:hypothetical protein
MITLGIFAFFTCHFLYNYIKSLREALHKTEMELVRVKSDKAIADARILLFERREKK